MKIIQRHIKHNNVISTYFSTEVSVLVGRLVDRSNCPPVLIGLSVCSSLTRSSGVLIWKYAVWIILVWKYVLVWNIVCAYDRWWSRWFDKSASLALSAALVKRLSLYGRMVHIHFHFMMETDSHYPNYSLLPVSFGRFTQCLWLNQQTHYFWPAIFPVRFDSAFLRRHLLLLRTCVFV